MPHGAMYQLRTEIIQNIHDLDGQINHHKWQAYELEHRKQHKQKQLEGLNQEIANVERYEKEQRELAEESQAVVQ